MKSVNLPSRNRPNRHHQAHRAWYERITRTHVGLAIVAVLMVILVVFAIQAKRASSSLALASNQADVLQGQVVAGDDKGARDTLAALQVTADKARARTNGVLWKVGSRVPFVGNNVEAVRTVAEVVDDLATRAMPPVVELSSQINLNSFSPRDGKIDLDTIRTIRPSVIAAATALTAADDKLDSIDAGSLMLPVRGPVTSVKDKIKSAQSAAISSRTAARLMPSMLGANKPRRYLLMIQNNAEIRPTGGIAGSFAIIKADKGKLTMGKQGSILDLLPFAKPVVPMTPDEASVFSGDLVTDLRDANFTPDFPRTGQITSAMVAKGLGTKVDGVISIDPIALSYILGGTGPVVLSDGTVLDQTNAVDALLNGVYRKYQDPVKQDDFFESAARRIFDVVKSGRGDSRTVISGLVSAANQNRLTLWSSHDAEQGEIARTGISGIVGGDDGKNPHIGVYLSDAAGGKMEYYLDFATVARSTRCLASGIQEFSTSTELVSNAPDNAKKLSPYITGTGRYTPRGSMRIYLRFYSPYDGGITEVRVNGEKQTVYADRHLGRNVSRVSVQLDPGQSYVVTTKMISGRGQTGDAVLSSTPGIHSTFNDVRVASACG